MSKERPHFISGKLLRALQGETIDTSVGRLPDKGAHLWGVEGQEGGKGILRHVLLASRVAYRLAQRLQERRVAGYKNINLQSVVEAAILHDVTKLYAEDREKLTTADKEKVGLTPDFGELSPEVDATGEAWLTEWGFSPEVRRAIAEHDFPERIVDDPYWKIVLLADYMTGQQVQGVRDRLKDVKRRWIDIPLEQGSSPRVDPQRFVQAEKNITTVGDEIFDSLRTTDQQFIEQEALNSEEAMMRWEKFILKTAESNKEARALRLVKRLIDREQS